MSSYRTRRIVSSALQLLVVVVVVGVAFWWFQTNRTDPKALSQEELRALATHFDGGTFAALPATRTIVVTRPDRSIVSILLDRLPPPLGDGPQMEAQALYDTESHEIRVIGEQARAEATFPRQMQPTFLATIRHEYGHAFIEDYMLAVGYKTYDDEFLAFTEPGSEIDTGDYPEAIRPVVVEWDKLPSDIYGQPYLSATFIEYMAESYRRLIEGDPVPPQTEAFLRSWTTTAPTTTQ